MSDRTRNRDESGVAPRIEQDLLALHRRSRRHVTPLDQTMRALSGKRPERSWEEYLMSSFGFFKARPRLATFAAVAFIATVLLAVPVSYERTVGQKVTLDLAGPGLGREVVKGIATEIKAMLGAPSVSVAAMGEVGNLRYKLVANSPATNGRATRARAAALAHTLAERGYAAAAQVEAVKEKTSGSVYAMVRDNVIRIETQGRTPQELEAEIAQKLAEAGIPNAQISVTRDGDAGTQIRIEAERDEADGPCPLESAPNLVLTVNGEEPEANADRAMCRIKKIADENGEHMQVEVSKNGQTATATVDNPSGMSDSDLAAAINSLLAQQGVNVSVMVEGGRIQIAEMGTDPGAGARSAPAVDEKTWGGVKHELGTTR